MLGRLGGATVGGKLSVRPGKLYFRQNWELLLGPDDGSLSQKTERWDYEGLLSFWWRSFEQQRLGSENFEFETTSCLKDLALVNMESERCRAGMACSQFQRPTRRFVETS
ncbi:hypothetical protein PoB_004680000 [Plakobranchus ocellatus]|uniref:Uncharacterized protein n=1 Tax=Plakobranchus ocellatus TaxID=259542 RepID=A0AAV4BML8_9GAST|nr:hypothetical protein PoB_004680000 [Plakobranchus ocellatus]